MTESTICRCGAHRLLTRGAVKTGGRAYVWKRLGVPAWRQDSRGQSGGIPLLEASFPDPDVLVDKLLNPGTGNVHSRVDAALPDKKEARSHCEHAW